MVEIFKDHGEVVMCVGSSCRLQNNSIFQVSDLAVAVATLPGDKQQIPVDISDLINRFPVYYGRSNRDTASKLAHNINNNNNNNSNNDNNDINNDNSNINGDNNYAKNDINIDNKNNNRNNNNNSNSNNNNNKSNNNNNSNNNSNHYNCNNNNNNNIKLERGNSKIPKYVRRWSDNAGIEDPRPAQPRSPPKLKLNNNNKNKNDDENKIGNISSFHGNCIESVESIPDNSNSKTDVFNIGDKEGRGESEEEDRVSTSSTYSNIIEAVSVFDSESFSVLESYLTDSEGFPLLKNCDSFGYYFNGNSDSSDEDEKNKNKDGKCEIGEDGEGGGKEGVRVCNEINKAEKNINEIVIEYKNENENENEEKTGDWWRDEVEINDQNPISPPSPPSLPTPPRHHSSPFSSPFPSSFLRTPKTRTVKKDSKRNSLSFSKDSFNSDATTASITPVIHRIPRTQEDYDMNINSCVREKKDGNGNDDKNIKNDEVSELNDSHNKHEINIVSCEIEEEVEGGVVGDEGEEGEGKETDKKVKFTSPNQNQNDINDDDFSNFFISTFSSSVNSSDNEKN